MADKRDSVIFYHSQVNKCRKHMTSDQFGRLMEALFDFDEGLEPQVDDDIALAFELLSLQNEIDREKYEKKCQKNRENAKKGGAPLGNQNARKQPKQPNGFKNNPNDNDKKNEKKNKNDDDNDSHDDFFTFGSFKNVKLTENEYLVLGETYERSAELIDKVSMWLRTAKNDVPDHYALCVKFADNDKWPKRKVIEPAELPKVEDPLSEEEQAERMSKMKAQLGGMFEA